MFTETMETVDTAIRPFVIDAWRYNRGVSGAWNEGIKRARAEGYEYALISNDDLKYTPGTIRSLYDTIVDTGAVLVSPNQQRHPRRENSYKMEGLREGADMFCFIIDIEQMVEEAGWFDENFFPAYYEDNDMHHRMVSAGLTCLIDTGRIVMHEGSMTQNADPANPNTSAERFEAHKGYFIKKWGGPPMSPAWTRPFNHPDLTVRDWNGSMVLDGLESSPSQDILDSLDSLCHNVAYESY
jgi:GT2 family glycosyltransferase